MLFGLNVNVSVNSVNRICKNLFDFVNMVCFLFKEWGVW